MVAPLLAASVVGASVVAGYRIAKNHTANALSAILPKEKLDSSVVPVSRDINRDLAASMLAA